MFVKPDGEGTARNIFERTKIEYLTETYRGKYKLGVFKFQIKKD
jgi:hypothetical protein